MDSQESISSFCVHPFSRIYVYFYGTLGLWLSLRNLQNNFGKPPKRTEPKQNVDAHDDNVITMVNPMVDHDLKIIDSSLGIMQYACLLTGCLTGKPLLFLPHLGGQLITIVANIVNTVLLLPGVMKKPLFKKVYLGISTRRIVTLIRWCTTLSLMSFSYSQEYCVFRQCLSDV